MKKLLAICLLCVLLLGCNNAKSQMERALLLRQQLLGANGCSFTATVSADYEDILYTFALNCHADKQGKITFTVLSPEEIAGITGVIGSQGGKLTFDDKMLSFPLLADGLMSPVCMPWLVLRAAREGFIKSCGDEADGICISINDTYAQEAINVDLFTDSNDKPIHADIMLNGRRIGSIEITDFCYV